MQDKQRDGLTLKAFWMSCLHFHFAIVFFRFLRNVRSDDPWSPHGYSITLTLNVCCWICPTTTSSMVDRFIASKSPILYSSSLQWWSSYLPFIFPYSLLHFWMASRCSYFGSDQGVCPSSRWLLWNSGLNPINTSSFQCFYWSTCLGGVRLSQVCSPIPQRSAPAHH